MTPEAVELITDWWVKCLVWFMILSALPMAIFVGFTVWKATKEMLDHVERERQRDEAIPRGKRITRKPRLAVTKWTRLKHIPFIKKRTVCDAWYRHDGSDVHFWTEYKLSFW